MSTDLSHCCIVLAVYRYSGNQGYNRNGECKESMALLNI